MIIYH